MASQVRTVALDTESTGLNASKDALLEVAAAEFNPVTGEVLSRWHSFINPGRKKIPAEATAVHGLTAEKLKDAPAFADVADSLGKFVEGARVVIHNAPYDTKLLDLVFQKEALPTLTLRAKEIICTVRMARRVISGKVTLDVLCKRFGVDLSARTLHGAEIDVHLLAQVFPHLVPLCQAKDELLRPLLPDIAGHGADMHRLCKAHVQLKGLIRELEAHLDGIGEQVRSVAQDKDYEDDDFLVEVSPQVRVNWQGIVKDKLPGLDVEPWRSELPNKKLTISAK